MSVKSSRQEISARLKPHPVLWHPLRFAYQLASGGFIKSLYYRYRRYRRVRGLQKYGVQCLRTVHAVCEELGLKPFLAYGTLLGHHRENGFIHHDYDIDLGLMAEDDPDMEALKRAMLKAGFLVSLDGLLGGPLASIGKYSTTQFYDPIKYVYIDFWMFQHHGCHVVNIQDRSLDGFFQQHLEDESVLRTEFLGYAMFFPQELFSEFKQVDFMGRRFRVPYHTEPFLAAAYGDWNKPRRNFRYRNLRLIQEKNNNSSFDFIEPGFA